jgi:uncharacterized membrane protein YfbV (UPF0208 family)
MLVSGGNMKLLSYLKFTRAWFKVSRVVARISIFACCISLMILHNLQADMTKMLIALAMNLAGLWVCEHGMEVVEERIIEEEKKDL